jgi:hypothetical protein
MELLHMTAFSGQVGGMVECTSCRIIDVFPLVSIVTDAKTIAGQCPCATKRGFISLNEQDLEIRLDD